MTLNDNSTTSNRSVRQRLANRFGRTATATNSIATGGGNLLLTHSPHLRDDDASSVMVESVPPQHKFQSPTGNGKRGTVRSVRSSLKKISGSSKSKKSSSSSSSASSANPTFYDLETEAEEVYLAQKRDHRGDRRSAVRSVVRKAIGSRKISGLTFSSSSSSSFTKRSSSRVPMSEHDLEENRLSRASTNPKFEAPPESVTRKAPSLSVSGRGGKRKTGGKSSSRVKAIFASKVKSPAGESSGTNKKELNKKKSMGGGRDKKNSKTSKTDESAPSSGAQSAEIVSHIVKSAPPAEPTEFIQNEPVVVGSAADSEVRKQFKDTYRLAPMSGPAYSARSNKGGPGNRTMKFYVGDQLVEQRRA
jgi:hypothetical protein